MTDQPYTLICYRITTHERQELRANLLTLPSALQVMHAEQQRPWDSVALAPVAEAEVLPISVTGKRVLARGEVKRLPVGRRTPEQGGTA